MSKTANEMSKTAKVPYSPPRLFELGDIRRIVLAGPSQGKTPGTLDGRSDEFQARGTVD